MEPTKIEHEVVDHHGEPWMVTRIVMPIRGSGRNVQVSIVLPDAQASSLMDVGDAFGAQLLQVLRQSVRTVLKKRRDLEASDGA